MKIKKQDIKIALRAASITAVCIICFAVIYLGCALSFEAIQQVCFGQTRPAVAIGEDYIRFFDFVFEF